MKAPIYGKFFLLVTAVVPVSCVKNSNPAPIQDTITVTRYDTLQVQLPADTPNLTNGLVLYLPFTNGSYADSSGLGNTVTAVNGGTLGYDMHGYAQSAFTESGNGGVLEVSNNGAYAVDTAFSISFDFMIRSYPYYNCCGDYSGLQTFLSIVNFSNGYGPTFDVGFNDPNHPTQFTFDVNSTDGSTCNDWGQNNPNSGKFDTTGFTPQLGAWYNAICIFSKGTNTIYINGQFINSRKMTTDTALFCPDANFIVGGWWEGTEPTNGEIDEVRMYNRTLSAAQIAWLSRNFQIHSTGTNRAQLEGKTGNTH